MKKICFFSSDARTLYKKDVFRVMALPKGYTIHFRYLFKYVNLALDKIEDFKNRDCVIFFSYGNDLKNPLPLKNVSLREAIIEDIKEK